MNIDINDVIAVLQDEGVDTEKIQKVKKDLIEIAESAKGDVEAGPPTKYQPLVICTDPNINLSSAPLFILEHVDEMNHEEAVKAFMAAIREHNTTAKKKRIIGTVGRGFLYLVGKHLKAAGLKVKFREAVIAVSVHNTIEGVADAEAGAEG